MDEYTQSRRAGAKIFRLAIKHLQKHDWDRNSMDTLLTVSEDKKWPQPMAVLMFSELQNALGDKTLSQFDLQAGNKEEVINLFDQVATELETTSN